MAFGQKQYNSDVIRISEKPFNKENSQTAELSKILSKSGLSDRVLSCPEFLGRVTVYMT